MLVEKNAPLKPYNTFGIAARASGLVRVRSITDLLSFVRTMAEQRRMELAPSRRIAPCWEPLVLGAGSNTIFTGDVRRPVLKMEITGKRVLLETPRGWLVEAGAGERWHDLVHWTVSNGMPGLENLALIPGTVGAAPVQNIGAYGVELKDRFYSLDAIDLNTGRQLTLDLAQCAFGYRDSVFKHQPPAPAAAARGSESARALSRLPAETGGRAQPTPAAAGGGMGLAGQVAIVTVRFWLSKAWKPVLEYHDLQRRLAQSGVQPSAQQIFDWVVEIRRSKLPDPAEIGNAGSFFKNPSVTQEQCHDIISREPGIVHYPMPDGSVKLAAGSMIDACGWKGKSVGNAGVYEKQALVLVNLGRGENSATGGEVVTLAKAIQTSVYERYGILLEAEPVMV